MKTLRRRSARLGSSSDLPVRLRAMFLSWIVLIIALIIFSVLGVLLFAAIFGRGEAVPPMMESADVKQANREAVAEGRYGDLQLEVVHRGYRMDQVDALIAQLTGQENAGDVAAGQASVTNAVPDEVGQKSVDSTKVSVEAKGESDAWQQ